MDPVLVVGGGIAGVACARVLADAGRDVRVLDRGRVIGGRMASRRTDGRPVDTGASYLTASDPGFSAVVQDWHARGLARPWTDTFAAVDDSGSQTKPGPMRWGAAGGLRSLVEDLAAGLDIESGRTATRVRRGQGLSVDGEPATAVVLAMPDPQATRLLDDGLADVRSALTTAFDPVLALTATFAERPWDLDGAFVNDDPVLDWVADDGRRRGDGAPVLVAHSSSPYAAQHRDDPEAAVPALVEALRSRFGLPEPLHTHVQRWGFGRPAHGRDQPYLLSDDNVGACGDSWSAKPRVEGAYLSGRALGQALLDRLS